MKRRTTSGRATRLLRLLAFGDSALPVGAFSFSNGLETAVAEGLVRDAATLEAFVRDLTVQSAFTEGVAALQAHRARLAEDYGRFRTVDRTLYAYRLGDEGRRMTCRMGRKLAELAAELLADGFIARWIADIGAGRTPGTLNGRTSANQVVEFPGDVSLIGSFQQVEITQPGVWAHKGRLLVGTESEKE